MLKPKVLPKILEQSISSGVKASILITLGGDLLASSGGDPNDKLVGAIALNIWNSYQKVSKEMKCLLIECEQGRLAISKVSDFLLCVYGDSSSQFGMLKAKLETLRQYLEEPLRQLVS